MARDGCDGRRGPLPGDETWHKLPFYAAHHVDEILIVDPAELTVTWLALRGGEYEPLGKAA